MDGNESKVGSVSSRVNEVETSIFAKTLGLYSPPAPNNP